MQPHCDHAEKCLRASMARLDTLSADLTGCDSYSRKHLRRSAAASQDSHEDIGVNDDSLTGISLEELQRLKKDGYEVFAKQTNKKSGSAAGNKALKRKNKNSPMMMSTKFRIPRYRQVVDTKDTIRQVGIDPRFEDLSGEFNEHFFYEGYGFLDDMRDEEIRAMKKSHVKKGIHAREKNELTAEITRLQQVRARSLRSRHARKARAKHNKTNRERLKAGQRAFFPKKRQLREEASKLQYEDLKAKGGSKAVQTKLRRIREKKRRKANKKQRHQMPRSR